MKAVIFQPSPPLQNRLPHHPQELSTRIAGHDLRTAQKCRPWTKCPDPGILDKGFHENDSHNSFVGRFGIKYPLRREGMNPAHLKKKNMVVVLSLARKTPGKKTKTP